MGNGSIVTEESKWTDRQGADAFPPGDNDVHRNRNATSKGGREHDMTQLEYLEIKYRLYVEALDKAKTDRERCRLVNEIVEAGREIRAMVLLQSQ